MNILILFFMTTLNANPPIHTNFVCANNDFKIRGIVIDSKLEDLKFWYQDINYPIRVIASLTAFLEDFNVFKIKIAPHEFNFFPEMELSGIIERLDSSDYPENFPKFEEQLATTWVSSSTLSVGKHRNRTIYNLPCSGDDYRDFYLYR